MAAQVPRPGGPVRGSTTGRALMAALDLLGRRWALRILWELRAEPLGARALQARCDRMSSSVLYERLAELTAAGLLARDEAGAYLLTDLGAALAPALESLDCWARRWAQILQETDRTPYTRDSLPRSSGPPHRARDTTGRSVKDLHPERTVVFRPPHRHGPADASPVTAGLPKPATGLWSPDRNCHPRASGPGCIRPTVSCSVWVGRIRWLSSRTIPTPSAPRSSARFMTHRYLCQVATDGSPRTKTSGKSRKSSVCRSARSVRRFG